MTPMVNADYGKCACGRSKSGYCDGSHAISIDEWMSRMIDREHDDSVFPDLPVDSDLKRNPYART